MESDRSRRFSSKTFPKFQSVLYLREGSSVSQRLEIDVCHFTLQLSSPSLGASTLNEQR